MRPEGQQGGRGGLSVSAPTRQALQLQPVLEELRAEGITTLAGFAEAYNERGMQTPRQWHTSSVRNLLARIGVTPAPATQSGHPVTIKQAAREVCDRVLSGDPVMAIFRRRKSRCISFVSCVPFTALLH